ncbi:MAG: IPExxxVDY family protein [Flavobacteriales bacterium]|nr:IPExxxVDY family protein [Flavobacteriales bacterium]
MAKHKLLEEEVTPRVSVVGLSCHVPDYRLCWSLNRALGLSLSRRRIDIVEQARGKDLHYTVFEQLDDEGVARWSLVCNTCGRRRLITDQKKADFFLVVDADTAGSEEGLMERLRAAEFVLMAFPVPFDEVRTGHKLLL